jgi:hypothetical protein
VSLLKWNVGLVRLRVSQLRQVRQAVAAGAIDFAVSWLPRVAAGRSIAAGAIDFAVSWLPRVAASQSIAAGVIDFAVICCLLACRVWLRVSQLRQVQSILRFPCCLVRLRVRQ